MEGAHWVLSARVSGGRGRGPAHSAGEERWVSAPAPNRTSARPSSRLYARKKIVWELLRAKRMDGTKFRRQHPIGP